MVTVTVCRHVVRVIEKCVEKDTSCKLGIDPEAKRVIKNVSKGWVFTTALLVRREMFSFVVGKW